MAKLRERTMLATVMGSMAGAIVRETGDATPASPFASALIGSGASLLARRDRRSVGLILIAAGGLLLWRQAASAERKRLGALRPARTRPAPAPAGASVSAA